MATSWTIAVDEQTVRLRDEISEKYPLVSKHRIAKLCLQHGTRAIAQEPSLLEEEASIQGGNESHGMERGGVL